MQQTIRLGITTRTTLYKTCRTGWPTGFHPPWAVVDVRHSRWMPMAMDMRYLIMP
jgi:hypothetical protein